MVIAKVMFYCSKQVKKIKRSNACWNNCECINKSEQPVVKMFVVLMVYW